MLWPRGAVWVLAVATGASLVTTTVSVVVAEFRNPSLAFQVNVRLPGGVSAGTE